MTDMFAEPTISAAANEVSAMDICTLITEEPDENKEREPRPKLRQNMPLFSHHNALYPEDNYCVLDALQNAFWLLGMPYRFPADKSKLQVLVKSYNAVNKEQEHMDTTGNFTKEGLMSLVRAFNQLYAIHFEKKPVLKLKKLWQSTPINKPHWLQITQAMTPEQILLVWGKWTPHELKNTDVYETSHIMYNRTNWV